MRHYRIYQTSNNGVKDSAIGGQEKIESEILIGSSKKNNHLLAQIKITHNLIEDKEYGKLHQFTLKIDGITIKNRYFEDNRGAPGLLINEL